MIVIAPTQLQELIQNLFLKKGVSSEEAEAISSHLVESNLAGHDSHGVIRACWYIDKIDKGELVPGAPIKIENETPSSAIVNGNWGFGQTIANVAIKLAIEKAKKQVISCVTVRQCNHVGRLGAYTGLASEIGMVGIGMANLHGTSHCVAPFGGRDPRLPTNPISIAFPKGSHPDFLLDMTSSIVAEGKVKVKFNEEKQTPQGWIIDSEGNPTEDPAKFYATPRGSLLPLGGEIGYKGFGLSLAIDALSGALSQAFCSNPESKRHGNACLFIVIRIDAFSPLETFESKVNDLIKHVKSSRPANKENPILIPGEPEMLSLKNKKENGIILDDTTWQQLCQKAATLAVTLPETTTWSDATSHNSQS